MSLGEDGLFFASQEDRGVSGLDAQPVVSATGAGDALFAGVVYGYLEEQTLSMSAHAAMTLARLALQSERPVSESVSRSRLERHLAERAS